MLKGKRATHERHRANARGPFCDRSVQPHLCPTRRTEGITADPVDLGTTLRVLAADSTSPFPRDCRPFDWDGSRGPTRAQQSRPINVRIPTGLDLWLAASDMTTAQYRNVVHTCGMVWYELSWRGYLTQKSASFSNPTVKHLTHSTPQACSSSSVKVGEPRFRAASPLHRGSSNLQRERFFHGNDTRLSVTNKKVHELVETFNLESHTGSRYTEVGFGCLDGAPLKEPQLSMPTRNGHHGFMHMFMKQKRFISCFGTRTRDEGST